ncbi:FKBP-type peptidyl-prolyl cis-trans isomerase [Candidatus Dependentiae bacterium]|nr:FKBP-type peptidyl-prolyl cis-trans isomerase [Candidatus Dependentiae bacterium]
MNKTLGILLSITLLSKITFTKQENKKEGANNMLNIGQSLDLNQFKKDNNGILHQVIKPGTEKKACLGETATVHYTGYLLEGNNKVGKKFDSSKDRNQPFQFQVGKGQVIRGWDLTLPNMTIGEHRIIILSPNLAYGAQNIGNIIPANSSLIFEIELLKSH